MTRVDLASLKDRLNESLNTSVDERKWAEKLEALIEVYGNYQKSKTHSANQQVQVEQGALAGAEEEKMKMLAEKIDRFNNHTSAVFILVDSVQTTEGKKYKEEFVFLPDDEAADLVESRIASAQGKKVHAYQVISDFHHYIHGFLKAGDIVPLAEDSARWFEPTYVVRLRSVRNLRIIPA